MNPLVTVIIPTYNRQAFLREAIESVLQQDYRPYELIVVDDGSTDDTKVLLKEYPSITSLTQENRGPSAARNRGIAHAKGTLVSFLDSDDLWLPNKLSVQVACMEKNPAVPVSYTDEVWVRKGRRVNPMKKHQKHSGWIFEHCLPLCIISPSSVMIHGKVFDRIGTFDETLPVCEDYDLWLRITARFPVKLIEQQLIIKRGGHEDQLSSRSWGNDRFRVQALKKIINDQHLDEDIKKMAIVELIKKSAILERGFRKRRKTHEADYYQQIMEEYGS